LLATTAAHHLVEAPGPELVREDPELVPDGRRAAVDEVALPVGLLERQLTGESGRGGEQAPERGFRQVPGRAPEGRVHAEPYVEDPHDVLLRQLARLRVGRSDGDRDVDGELVAARRVAVPLAGLAVLPVDLGNPLDWREDHEIREAPLRCPLDGLARALRWAPHGWVRLLERAGQRC